jgi:hypothetical protein
MFQVEDGGGGIPNELTGDFTCPSAEFTPVQFGRVLPRAGVGANQFVCQGAAGATPVGARAFGGAFQTGGVDCEAKHTRGRPNPITGTVGCPSGYTPVRYGQAIMPECNQERVDQFFCVL